MVREFRLSVRKGVEVDATQLHIYKAFVKGGSVMPALGCIGNCCGLGRATLSNPRGLVALGTSTGSVVCLG